VTLERGDVIKVLDPEGRVALPGHPIVVLLISGGSALFSNMTDIEKEDDVPCVLNPQDDPSFIEKRSTFRYQNIREQPVATLELAIKEKKLAYCGKLAPAALEKILAGVNLSRLIKPKYRTKLQGPV
jgi:hypothetical protein